MANWVGGLLAGVGGAAAGGFKAMGENADENIRARAEQVKIDALAYREKNLEELRQQFHAADTTRKINADKDIQAKNLEERTKERTREDELRFEERARRDAERMEDKKDQREYQREMLASRRGSGEGGSGLKGEYLKIDPHTNPETGQVTYVGLKKDGTLKVLEPDKPVYGKTVSTAKADLEAQKALSKSVLDYNEAIASGNYNGARAIAAANNLPLIEKEVVTKKKWFGEDEKMSVPELDYKKLSGGGGLVAPKGGAAPDASGGSSPQPKQAPSPKDIYADILNKEKQGASPQAEKPTPQRQGATPEPAKQPLDKNRLIEIMSKPDESTTGPYKSSYAPGESASLLTSVQKKAAWSQPDDAPKLGEGELEFAIRKAGIADDLAVQKDYARNLKKEFPKMSDKELAELILSATEQAKQ